RKKGKRRKGGKKALAPVVSRYVDMWAFLRMHPTNVDLLQRLKSADDLQFGANMDVCGTVSSKDPKGGGWDKTHMVGIRSDAWNSDAQRRLVLKLFKTTGEQLRWVGTVEEITTREIHNSIGSQQAMLTLAAILPDYEFLVNVQQNHRTFRIPSIFTFCFHDEDENRAWYLDIKRKWVSVGADFVVESGGRKIAEIDGKLIGFGYNAYVHVHEPTLADNRRFVDLLTLFAASVGYHRAMRRSVRQRVRAIQSGQPLAHVVEDEESCLLKNPRRRAA
ncbi:MAG TPA: hypothetical protein VJL29_14530, partial [Thermoguttaceae bacterium]|nr:hypothetical protein [Thermoguttaceae bacterium]